MKTVESVYKEEVNIVKCGEVISILREEGPDYQLSFTLAAKETELTVVTAHMSGLVRIWD